MEDSRFPRMPDSTPPRVSLLTLKNTAVRKIAGAAKWILRASRRRARGFTEIPEGVAPTRTGMPEQVLVAAALLLRGAKVTDWHGKTVVVGGRRIHRTHVNAAKQAIRWSRAALRAEKERLAAEREVDAADLPFWSLRAYLRPLLQPWV